MGVHVVNQIFWALLLTAVSAVPHGVYTMSLLRRLKKLRAHPHSVGIRDWWLLSEIICCILALHASEAALWAAFYLWKGGFPDFAASLYFSITSYATTGYGDLLLPESIRLVGACEGMAGTLLSGWSVALILAMLQTMLRPGCAPSSKG